MVAEVVVVATNTANIARCQVTTCSFIVGILLSLVVSPSMAVVLPKDRADVLYHRYDGGGMEIDGPSVLVRKSIADKVSIAANYYVDNVTSASIDVIASGASEYTESRKEGSLDITLLENKSLINIGITKSSESDYEAESYRFDVSQDFFGDMITASIGYSQADDEVGKNTSDPNDFFSEHVDRRHYRFGLSWILLKSLFVNFNYEGINDEGFLNNPYRSVRFNVGGSSVSDTEKYPRTRNSDAFSLKASYHLPYSAAVKLRASYFTDSWSIDANSIELEYSQRVNQRWLADVRLRYYQQSAAEFYADIFPDPLLVQQQFQARDKELSTFASYTIGGGASYSRHYNQHIDEVRLSLQFDWMYFDYDNFREATSENTALYGLGNEPLYNFDAYALRLFVSLFY